MKASSIAVIAACAAFLSITSAAAQEPPKRSPTLPSQGIQVPPRDVPPVSVPLTMHECNDLGGSIIHDASCPETTTGFTSGGKIKGKFRCIGRGLGSSRCIDEDAGV
jgi:hypothetical protein